MQLRDLPHTDPGEPDVRSGRHFLVWLGRMQLGGQVAALLWGLVWMLPLGAMPLAVGMAVQAVVDRNGGRLAVAGALLIAFGALMALGDSMLHRAAVTNWITAASRVQQLLARKAADLGSILTRRVAAGEVVAVSTGDVEKIGWFVESFSRFTAALFTALAVTAGLVVYAPELGLLVAVALPVLALAPLPLLPYATRRADDQRAKAGRATELAADTVAGLRVLRGIGGEELFLDRYREASQKVRTAAVRSARMWALIHAVQVALPGVLLVVVVGHGVGLARNGTITVGELVTVYGAVTFLLFPMHHFAELAMAYSFSRPSAKRAARVLGLARTTTGGTGTDHGPLGGELHDPATGLRAAAGRLTAVVCGDPDAAGRLADRLGGHPAEPGELPSVRLGGMELDDVPLAGARTAVLVQDKDPMLLSGTLADLLDVPASGSVKPAAALAAAQCGDVLTALAQAAAAVPDGDGAPMGAPITERGRSLSGGQRQRLALARSLVADPEVLVLDEPTSAVDSHTEARIAEGLREIRAGRTTVVFTSSPLLLDRADTVVFVQDGAVVSEGPHRELLHGDVAYRAVVTRETDDEKQAPGRVPEGEPAVRDEGGVPQMMEETA
ncbi:ABC transporter ATP-binding protein/permease [Streptomyces sp. NBC_01808]|uniref:ABC transporter ATP-binding protein n=1 Tax=Streptomyces sp. NBC_01808 TaxID=2975947 RepID=UPI002DD9390F|nr:ABC transporter ATP-binding protein [Streptomyces sp. NBC_01808]WSA36517.1 ABC transporter ATP-binding protein/permease [Streptomyces sp. NBC_01808]